MIKPPKLESYSVAPAPAPQEDAPGLTAAGAHPARFVIILHGQNFVERAQMLVVKIGDLFVSECSISPDQKSITCYLDELPEEGSVIRVGYSPDEMVELPEPFSRTKLENGETAPEV